MEFKCLKDDLYEGVQGVERIVSTRSTLPIIGNILFEASKSGLKLSANNLEMGMEITLPAKVESEGSILLPAKTLGEIVSKLPSGEVGFKASEKGLVKISYQESNLNIHGLPADEFPQLPKIKEAKTLTLNPTVFTKMIKQTIFSVSLSEEKYVLNGVLIEIGKNLVESDSSNICLVATDGYRLAKRADKLSPPPAGASSVIVPARALNEVLRILQSGEEKELKIMFSQDQVAFKYKNAHLVSRLIQGQFPDYRQVIPKGSEIKLTLDTQKFLEACLRAGIIAAGSGNIVRLEVKKNKLHIIASTPDVGNVDEVLEAAVAGGERAQIAFNVKLIVDALKVIEEEKVVLELAGPLSPGVMRPAGALDYTYIIMPIRTTETAG